MTLDTRENGPVVETVYACTTCDSIYVTTKKEPECCNNTMETTGWFETIKEERPDK